MTRDRDPVLAYSAGWWVLRQPYRFALADCALTVPAGFGFDLASIPRALWAIPGFAPFELGIAPPLLHDYLYRWRGCPPADACEPYRTWTRREADRELLWAMEREGVPAWRRRAVYAAVRAGGRASWVETDRQRTARAVAARWVGGVEWVA